MKKIIILILLFCAHNFAQQFKFAWLTDVHIGYPTAAEDLERSVKDINSQDDVNFTIVSGDITAIGSLSELTTAKSILDKLEKPYYIIPGNHDTKWSESGCTDFIKLWSNDRFVFEEQGILFIGLHEGPRMRMADGYFAPEDLRWFDSLTVSLPNPKQPLVFVTHYPLDEGIANWYEMLDRLKKLDTQLTIFGHGHNNKFYDFEGIPGVMGRSNLRANKDVGGYNIVVVKNDSVYFTEKNPGKELNASWITVPLYKKKSKSVENKKDRPDYSINQKYNFVNTLWEYDTGYTIGSSAIIKDSSVLVGDASGNFYSIDLTNGTLNWRFKTGNAIYSTGATKDNSVVFGSADSSIYCLKINDGKLIWKYKTNAAVLGCPVIKDNNVFIGGSDKIFRAINLETGKLVWEFDGLEGFVEITMSAG